PESGFQSLSVGLLLMFNRSSINSEFALDLLFHFGHGYIPSLQIGRTIPLHSKGVYYDQIDY
ncbi:hypothetical protein, partial [Bacteroides bouchesdurhonensis]|uniref:hypothetical protein n=1 Tax=Bacteroides bouchesdurhonensis TaxID=1841855 RepID=UPI001C9E8B9D